MGDLSEFTLPVRLFLRSYRWRAIKQTPWAPLSKPLAESTLALVSSAGLVMPDQEPFDSSVRGGDPTYRVIPSEIDLGSLVDSHRSESYDHSGVQRDPNLALPLDRARELVASGRIGALNHRHLSFMGSITAPGRLMRPFAIRP
ncbi:MAG: glycine/sarcosine/betaine reductase selenoprotein B family protein [Acidobacteriota bacterium]